MSRQRIRTLCVCFLLSVGFGTAWTQRAQIGRIARIDVSGNQTADADVVKLSSGLTVGSEVGEEDLQKAVKQLWALGIFSDVRIVLDERTPDGLALTIQVAENPRLARVMVHGNDKIKTEDIEKEAGFFRGQVISPGQITKAKNKIYKLYSDKGYLLCEIDPKLVPAEKPGQTILELNIHEGRKVQIQKIRFHDNAVFSEKKLRKQMKETKEDRWWRGADFDPQKFDEDKNLILQYYRNHGYRDAEVVRDSVSYDDEKKDLFLDIWVREGSCMYFGRMSWEGNRLLSEPQLADQLEFKTGEPFNQEAFEKSIGEKLGGAYYDLGYINAQIIPRETLRGDTLDIHFAIDEGKPVTLRKIVIAGNTRTKEKVIRRELRVRPGDVFSKELLVRSVRELMMLNYFTNVTPEPTIIQGNNEQIDINLKVEEKSTDTANMSAGWSELDRLIGSVGFAMNNFLGNGQQLSLDWNFGRYYRSFNLGFTEPWFLNTPTLVGISVYDTKRDAYYIGYSQKSRGLSLRYGKRMSWPDNYFRGDWIYRYDVTSLGDFASWMIEYNPNNIVYEKWPLESSGVTQIISRNSLDQPEFPTHGSRVSLSTEIAGGIFKGNVGYHKHSFSAEMFFPTVIPKLVFLSRVQFGYMDILGKSGRVPYLEYFFIGGSGLSRSIPLRGYEDPLAGGSYTEWGGKTMFQTTAELRFPIIPNPLMFGLLFAEAGNTWPDLANTDPFDLKRSIGIGARMFMPMVGMIGFDYAYGYDNLDASGRKTGAWKTHFVFGKGF